MGYTTLTGGLNLVIPDIGEENWGSVIRTPTWEKINSHDHSGPPNGKQISAASIEANAIGKSQISKNLAFHQQTIDASGSSTAIDFNDGQTVILTLNADTTLVLNNALAGGRYVIYIIQSASPKTITWPANVKFSGNVEPTAFLDASSVAIVVLLYDGTNFYTHWDVNF